MCGRFTMFMQTQELVRRFHLKEGSAEIALPERYNAAPTQEMPVITADGNVRMMRWGLIPSWAKSASVGNSLINARAETIAEKPAFRSAFRSRRCLIPVNGFYEWKSYGKEKVPVYIRLQSGKPFALAGLWEAWKNPENADAPPILSFAIVTTEPNELLADIHNRMAVIFSPEQEALWLDSSLEIPELLGLLRPYPAEEMTAFAVSSRINSPRNDDKSLIEPAGDYLRRISPEPLTLL